ncbi:3D domain-containing protein [Caldalkalibacillus mannanilyticus]|uniref:3D domain-containing protein n=1 Tax=Caldalkalibacillus mannanilyticus TaxID=1418 RepID=UPI000688FBF5|nr:3D domain-containing protein [Caldalkalibacillus mannanilyticus]
MEAKRDLGIKMILVTLFMTSMVLSSMWMAGYLENESVTYTRYEKNNQDIVEVEVIQDQQSESVESEATLDPLFDYIHTHEGDEEAEKQKEQKLSISSIPKPTNDLAYDLELLESQINFGQYPTKKVTATGYTAGYESTGKKPDHPQYGITYSGVQVRRDLYSTIAADPAVFPIGTVLYIPKYGYGVVADTGSAIQGDKIDLYFESVEDVYQWWGKQKVEVYIIEEGNGTITEALLDNLNQDEAILVYKAL